METKEVSLVHSALISPDLLKLTSRGCFCCSLHPPSDETCIAEYQCCVSWEKPHQICLVGHCLWFSDMSLWCVCHEAGRCSPVKDAGCFPHCTGASGNVMCLCELSVYTAGQHCCLNVFQALPHLSLCFLMIFQTLAFIAVKK